MTSLLERATIALEEFNTLKKEISLAVKDTDIPHEVRWDLYLAWDKLGGDTDYSSYYGFDDICEKYIGESEVFCYDGLIHVDRYQSVSLIDAIPTLLERLADEDDEFFAVYHGHMDAHGYSDGYPKKSVESDEEFQAVLKDYYKVHTEATDIAHRLPIFNSFKQELQAQLMKDCISGFTYDW